MVKSTRGTVQVERTGDLFKELAQEEMTNVDFTKGSYTQFTHVKKAIIYCDPPYAKGSNFYNEKSEKKLFDQKVFIDWCKTMKRKGNLVIVSEHSGGVTVQRNRYRWKG